MCHFGWRTILAGQLSGAVPPARVGLIDRSAQDRSKAKPDEVD
jgi:hypothetical protein